MHILQGNNIRSYEGLPMPVSRKESFLIINEPPGFLFPDGLLLEQLIVWSKLLKFNSRHHQHLEDMLSASKTFRFQPLKINEDLSLARAFDLAGQILNDQAAQADVQEIVDFLEYKKYNEDPGYSLKGRTAASLLRQVEDWHFELDFKKYEKQENRFWGGDPASYTYTRHGKEYEISEIRSLEQLLKESQKLKHCAITYLEDCVEGPAFPVECKAEKQSRALQLSPHFGSASRPHYPGRRPPQQKAHYRRKGAGENVGRRNEL